MLPATALPGTTIEADVPIPNAKNAPVPDKMTSKKRRENLEKRMAPLRVPYEQGRVQIRLNRKDFMETALAALPLNPKEWRKTWRFSFIGEVMTFRLIDCSKPWLMLHSFLIDLDPSLQSMLAGLLVSFGASCRRHFSTPTLGFSNTARSTTSRIRSTLLRQHCTRRKWRSACSESVGGS